MGAIVSVPAKSVPVGVSKYLIIDGQQRLTTVCILLCAIRDCLDENGSRRIQEVYLINRYRDADDTLKFVPTHIDRNIFQRLVLGSGVEEIEGAIGDAYRFFLSKIRAGLDLNSETINAPRLLLVIEHALEVVMINLGDADDPYLIFESLNAKGQPLEQADLVRNYVLMQFRHSLAAGGDQERVYREYWKPMEDALGEKLTEYLRYYLMRTGEVIYLGGIYGSVKSRLRDLASSEQIENEVRQINRFSGFYRMILNPDLIPQKGIRERIHNIKALGVATSYPFLLRLFDALDAGTSSENDIESCAWLVESFIVRRSICGVPTNNLNKLFLQWCRSLPVANIAEWLRRAMSSGAGGRRFPNDVEFGEAFKFQPQYGRGATRFVLDRVENSYSHKEPADLRQATIEHVMPRTLTLSWHNDLGSSYSEIHGQYVDTFGNLTLTGYNSELGNLDFQSKKKILGDTHIEMNRWINQQEVWTDHEIRERADALLQRAKDLWMGPISAA